MTVPLQKAAKWQRETRARMLASQADKSCTRCVHLLHGGPQPVVVHAEHPTHLVCRVCSIAARAQRLPGLRRAARLESPADGREDVCMGPVAIYTRLRCAACHRPDPLAGAFGNGAS